MDPPNAQSSSQEHKTCDFFGLPREIRDMVYNDLFNHKTEIAPLSHDNPIEAVLEGCIKPYLLRISKAFSEEYLDTRRRLGSNLILTYPGHRPFRSLQPPSKIQSGQNIRQITISIVMNFLPNPDDLDAINTHVFYTEAEANRDWMEKVVEATRDQDIRESEICIFARKGFNAQDSVARRIMEETLGMLRSAGLPGLSCVRVKRLGPGSRPWPIPENLNDYGVWTSASGWIWN